MENPLRREFWLGEVDPRPLALFRIALGLVLLHDLSTYATHLTDYASDAGMLPRGAQGISYAWSLFNLVGDPRAVALLFAVGVAVTLAFTTGFHTWLSTALTWLFITSLHTRDLYVTDGGDDLVRVLLFLSLFTDLGGVWSADVALGRKPERKVPALGLRALQLHLALLYFVAARLKLRNGWLTHDNLYTTLQLDGFVRPPGHFLLGYPRLCRLLGISTVSLEGAYPFFSFSPWAIGWARAAAIACGFLVQFGILLTMRVGIFTETMLASCLLLVQPAWLDALLSPQTFPAVPARLPIGRLLAAAFLSFHFVSMAWGPFIGGRFALPAPLYAERKWLWLDQPFGLFDVTYDIPSWKITGVRADGAVADVLAEAEPEMIPRVGWRFSRWYKFICKERELPYRFPEFGRWLCRRYREETGEALRSFTLIKSWTPPAPPGGKAGEPRQRQIIEQLCDR